MRESTKVTIREFILVLVIESIMAIITRVLIEYNHWTLSIMVMAIITVGITTRLNYVHSLLIELLEQEEDK